MMTEATFSCDLLFDREVFLSLTKLAATLDTVLAARGEPLDGAMHDTFTGVSRRIGDATVALDLRQADDETRLAVILTGPDSPEREAEMQRRLAGLAAGLARALPVSTILWLDTGVALPAPAFCEAVEGRTAPLRISPRRVVPERRDPRRRSSYSGPERRRPDPAAPRRRTAQQDAHVAQYHAYIRESLLTDAQPAELEALQAESGALPIEARLSTWAVSAAVASFSLPLAVPLVASNILRGEDLRVASLVMGLAGLFVTLDAAGGMASVVN